MAVGQNSLFSGESYLAVGREVTYGTGVTTTAGIDFLSCSLKMMKEIKHLEQVERSRTYTKSLSLSRTVEGELDTYFRPLNAADNYLLQSAFGGAEVTSATATGETVGGLGFEHTYVVGSYDATYSSLSINERKGDATNGQVFETNGIRVNEMTFAAEIDEPLKATYSLIGKDITTTSNDVESALTTTCYRALSFVGGRFSVEATFAAITSTSFWHVDSFEFKLANNLKPDDGRRIGSDTLQALPYGIQSYELSATMRYDTTTAYDAMINATDLYGQFEFLGDTMTGSQVREGLKLNFQKLHVNESGDPEIGGPDEVLKSTVTFLVSRDCSSASGYAVQAEVTNLISGL